MLTVLRGTSRAARRAKIRGIEFGIRHHHLLGIDDNVVD